MSKVNTRLDRAKDKISKFENKYEEIILSTAQGGKYLWNRDWETELIFNKIYKGKIELGKGHI